jgi:hypothetical protein
MLHNCNVHNISKYLFSVLDQDSEVQLRIKEHKEGNVMISIKK